MPPLAALLWLDSALATTSGLNTPTNPRWTPTVRAPAPSHEASKTKARPRHPLPLPQC
jgi:hypothetical protein